MTGRDDGVSFAELLALESHLNDVRRIVLDQKEKIKLEEDERKKEAEHEANGTRRGVLVPPTSRLVERQKKPNGLAPLLNMKREFERRISEPLQSEFERLWLFNERMNGRELEGMTSLDLTLLHSQILGALKALNDQTFGPRVEQRARQRGEHVCLTNKESVSRLAEPERCSLDNGKDADTSLQFRLLLVSRKLRRIHNCYHRKSMPETYLK